MTKTDADVDRQLLAGIQSGDDGSLATLYDKYAARMLAVATGILRNRGDAEDLIHDVFIEAWQNAGGYDPRRGTVYSWLLVRVRSRAIDRLRSLQVAYRHQVLQKNEAPAVADSADDHARAQDAGAARRALSCLSAAQRNVVELGYFRGLTCSEIATRCGIPVGTVKSRLASAVVRLKRAMLETTEAK